MRSREEVGRLYLNEKANEAYRLYASLYLDWADDNMSHFRWRDIDIAPLNELEDKGIEVTDETAYDAFMESALDLARTAVKHIHLCKDSFPKGMESFYEEYPLLKNYEDELNAIAEQGEKESETLEEIVE